MRAIPSFRLLPSLPAALAGAVVLLTPMAGAAQAPPVLGPDDYGRWESLGAALFDPTGGWVAVSIRTVDSDPELRVHPSDGSAPPLVVPRGSRPVFTDDGRHLVYLQDPDDDADDGAPEADRRLGVVDLAARTDTLLFPSESFAVSADGRWVAARAAAPADTVGGDLTVLDLTSGERTTLGNVDAFAWRDSGALLALALRTASGTGDGVTLFDPATGAIRSLDAAGARYRTLTWRDDASDLAVLRSVEVDGREEPAHDLLLWRGLSAGVPSTPPAPRLLAALGRADLPDSLRIPETATLSWSADGRTVFVGLRPWASAAADDAAGADTDDEPEVRDGSPGRGPGGDAPGGDDERESDTDEEAADVEPSPVQIWHWNDDRILRAQEYFEASDGRRSMLAAWHVDEDRLVSLGTELDEPVRITADGRWGLVADLDPYAFERRFGASTQDVHRIDVATGERALLAAGLETFPVLGPAGRRALVHAEDGWSVVDLATLGRTALTTDLDATFTMPLDDYDYPGARPPYGVGGWSDDESVAWLHDRHDVWRADLASGRLERVTPGAEDGLEYRLINLDPEASAFDLTRAGLAVDAPLWVRILDPNTMASGYGRTDGAGGVDRTVFEDASVGRLTRSEEGGRFLLVKERFDDSPDLFVGGEELDDLRQLGATNPFQSDFAWGRNELLAYTTSAGHDLHAILTYPAAYDPSRTYPLILYQYERLSQGLHRYVVPSRTSYYNVQVWSQAGYFVLQPDIVYEPGRPGPSALDAIEHALDSALEAAPVDPDRMGIVGHSWGGYQAAYVPTRMHRFAAAVAGAAITNFLSFPGTVHWNGGLPELGHWETGQARMARPPWEDLEGHLESSPVAAIDDLETPMLLMHGDADGVVDFRQGLEFYNYARRLGKEVVLLVYPGADHGLRREENQVDYQRRILEWFGHYLKGDPAPGWITEGENWEERARRIGG